MKKKVSLGLIGTGATAITVGMRLVFKSKTRNKVEIVEEAIWEEEEIVEVEASDCNNGKWNYDEKAEAERIEEEYLQALAEAEAEETRKRREETQTKSNKEEKVEVSTEDLLEAEIRVFCENNKQYEALLVSKEFTRFKNLLMERKAILEKNECSGVSEVYRITNELLDIVSSL